MHEKKRATRKEASPPPAITLTLQDAILEWGAKHYQDYPWRTTNNHFHALIAEVMLQRTRVEQVLPIYEMFVQNYPTVQDAFNSDYSEFMKRLEPLGLKWRIKKIRELVIKLAEFDSVPTSYDELIKLPGVGEYSASAFLSFHVNKPIPIIDANIVRLWGRVFGIETSPETRRKPWLKELAIAITPKKKSGVFNLAVLDLSMLLCKQKPFCELCPISNVCHFNAG